ncbi:MAG TPA: hypothetical protein VKB25_09025 [Conexibacter sp.]|nr:hypothetical protein [Conexibacter sp.]
MHNDEHDRDTQHPPDERAGEPGSRGGDESPSADRLPAAPSDDDTPLGDTDQHSNVSSDPAADRAD